MLPALSHPSPGSSSPTLTPADNMALSPLERHREKSTNLLNQFLIALSHNDRETIKKIYTEISAELSTVGYLLRWDPDTAITHFKKIDPPMDAESLERLKDTAYAPMARYLALWRHHDNPLDDPSARSQILRILDEAEKTGANPDCINLIRGRCPPLQLDPGIVCHNERSLVDLNSILWAILNGYGNVIHQIYESNLNEITATGYLLGSDTINAGEYAKYCDPPICVNHLKHLKNTAYVPITRYLSLVQKRAR